MDHYDELRMRIDSDTRRIVVLDDDPTGTQTVSGVRVILNPLASAYRAYLQSSEKCAYVITNTRALSRENAISKIRKIKDEMEREASECGVALTFLMRGDSTLRGHVFAEIEAISSPQSTALFVPAFPECGRVTIDGIHYLELPEGRTPVSETEFSRDPVFGYNNSRLTEWVSEVTGGAWKAVSVPLDRLRSGGPSPIAACLVKGDSREVIIPDAETMDDLAIIALGLLQAEHTGKQVTTRVASSFAAVRAGIVGKKIEDPISCFGPVLMVCGSHTEASTRQLMKLSEVLSVMPLYANVAALAGSKAQAEEEKKRLEQKLREMLVSHRTVILATDRNLLLPFDYLASGEMIMSGICEIIANVSELIGAVISKGGITSAEVARKGLSAQEAWVEGQLAPGVSLWTVTTASGRQIPYAVIPGNVGNDTTLLQIARMFLVVTD